jgi:uracil phosphoribosyltransferase
MKNIHLNTHPIVQDRLTKIRDKGTSNADFRKYLSEIAVFLCTDATQNMRTTPVTVETPLTSYDGVELNGTPLIIPILRAGLALSEGMARLLPQADTGHIGLARDEETHEPVEYLVRLPKKMDRPIFVVDPMLATGGSMIATLDILIREGTKIEDIVIVTLLCAPEGIKALQEKYPSIPVYTAAIDDHLNENAFIVPGLGDAGDRFFGTD